MKILASRRDDLLREKSEYESTMKQYESEENDR